MARGERRGAGSNRLGRTYRLGCAVAVVVALLAAGTARAEEAKAPSAGEALAKQVEVRRTQYGVPHIQGETFEAVAFGFGYCQAEDHLPSILRGIVAARSELAATFGPDDQPRDGKNVTSDLFNRQFRVYRRAVQTYHKLDPDYRAMCEGFAAGINYYVARHPEAVPAWANEIAERGVTGHDVAAYGQAGVMRFAFNRSKIIEGFLKEHGGETAALVDESEREIGSNMWALAPSRSNSGRTILMGNPHQPWAPVSTYYEAHLIVPGKLNFYGSTFIGRPVLTSGWNEFLGWSHTVNYPDLEEIYELELDPAKPDHYRFDGSSLPLEREDVTIAVREQENAEDGSVSRTFWHTPLGPVILRTADKVYVLRSACYENYGAYGQWLRMTQAKNFEEFRRALEMNQIPMFNICYADRVGNIFYLYNGTVPKLPHPKNTTAPVKASRTSDLWTDFLTTRELPQLFNPPGGYVQNCNSPPFFTNLKAPLDPAKFPPYLQDNSVSLRTQHSLRLIGGDDKLSLQDVIQRKHSAGMLVAERVKPDLLKTLAEIKDNSEVTAAIAVLEAWDNTVKVESAGAPLFVEWWQRYENAGGKFAVEWSAAEPVESPRGLADPQLARESFLAALADVRQRYGRADMPWGEVYRIRRGNVDLPASGGSGLMGCFRVLDFRADNDGKQAANGGDGFVFAVEFSQPPQAYTILAYSQSEIPTSPHYNDQTPLFAAGKMKRAAFTDAEITSQLLKSYRPGEEK